MGVTYRAAWFMAHRLRYAISAEPLATSSRAPSKWTKATSVASAREAVAVVLPMVAGRPLWPSWWSVGATRRAMPMERIDAGVDGQRDP